MRATRAELETHPEAPLLDFDTGAELLYRFIDDLHAYAATYASLAVNTHERERWIERYEPKTNAIAAGVAADHRNGLPVLPSIAGTGSRGTGRACPGRSRLCQSLRWLG